MYSLIVVVHIIVSVFLVLVVLLQTGKGASMGVVFGGASSQTLFGSAGPASILTKLTAACAVVFMLTSLYLAYSFTPKFGSSVIDRVESKEAAPPMQPTSGE